MNEQLKTDFGKGIGFTLKPFGFKNNFGKLSNNSNPTCK